MLYMITYDLYRPQQDYAGLFAAIQAEGAALRCLQSVWLLQTNTDINLLQTRLMTHIAANDRVILVDITQRPRNGWMNRNVWTWMQQHDV